MRLISLILQKKLKTLKFKTPFDFLVERFKIVPKVFYQNPLRYSKGLNNYNILYKIEFLEIIIINKVLELIKFIWQQKSK